MRSIQRYSAIAKRAALLFLSVIILAACTDSVTGPSSSSDRPEQERTVPRGHGGICEADSRLLTDGACYEELM